MDDAAPAEKCLWCEEPVRQGEPFREIWHIHASGGGIRKWHQECFIRSIVGGVNHQLHTCSCPGCAGLDPPDWPEMTVREAAKAAAQLFYAHPGAGHAAAPPGSQAVKAWLSPDERARIEAVLSPAESIEVRRVRLLAETRVTSRQLVLEQALIPRDQSLELRFGGDDTWRICYAVEIQPVAGESAELGPWRHLTVSHEDEVSRPSPLVLAKLMVSFGFQYPVIFPQQYRNRGLTVHLMEPMP